ncbi:MAG TPA: hypothetical protein VNN23_02085 [Ornithinibacter sp.]|jgi:hypothetical protein|nr:hypothetical protein [Ornithinibacter sp.]
MAIAGWADPTGAIIRRIRQELVPDYPGMVVRGTQPGPDDKPPMVIVQRGSLVPMDRMDVERVRVVVRMYADIPPVAAEMFGKVAKMFHLQPHQTGADGIQIYQTRLGSAYAANEDPDTRWPYEICAIYVYTNAAKAS